MTPPLRALVTIEEFLSHPERVRSMDPSEAQRLAVQLAALLLSLTLRASEPSPASGPTREPGEPQWLSGEQVTQQFGLSSSWLAEHRRLLQSLGVVSKVSRKTVLYDRRKIQRFIESRRLTNSDVAS